MPATVQVHVAPSQRLRSAAAAVSRSAVAAASLVRRHINSVLKRLRSS